MRRGLGLSPGVLPIVGGNWDGGSYAGLFHFDADYLSDESNSNIGARHLDCTPLDVRKPSLTAR